MYVNTDKQCAKFFSKRVGKMVIDVILWTDRKTSLRIVFHKVIYSIFSIDAFKPEDHCRRKTTFKNQPSGKKLSPVVKISS